MKKYDIQFYNHNFGNVIWYRSETRNMFAVCARYGRYNAGDEITVWAGNRIAWRAVYSPEKHDYIRVNVDPMERGL